MKDKRENSQTDRAADEAAIDEVTDRFYRAFSTKAGRHANVDALYALFVPSAVIVKNTTLCGETYDVSTLIEPRRRLLAGTLAREFSEWETSGTTAIFGNIAHRFSFYKKSWVQSDVRCRGGGAKSLQFVRTASGWRIASLVWDDE